MRTELQRKLEGDVKEFQENLQRDEDSAYFRQLEADRLRGKFQLATRKAFYQKRLSFHVYKRRQSQNYIFIHTKRRKINRLLTGETGKYGAIEENR